MFLFKKFIKSILFEFLKSGTFSLKVTPKKRHLEFLDSLFEISLPTNSTILSLVFLPDKMTSGLIFKAFALFPLSNKDQHLYNGLQLILV